MDFRLAADGNSSSRLLRAVGGAFLLRRRFLLLLVVVDADDGEVRGAAHLDGGGVVHDVVVAGGQGASGYRRFGQRRRSCGLVDRISRTGLALIFFLNLFIKVVFKELFHLLNFFP